MRGRRQESSEEEGSGKESEEGAVYQDVKNSYIHAPWMFVFAHAHTHARSHKSHSHS
jgi:hypothetical protein